jgi:glutamate/tyrosine decarboxylase-like PLP-dependent enzyme
MTQATSPAPVVEDRDPLAVDPDTMRELGYRAIDLLVERFTHLGEQPAVVAATRAEMDVRVREPAPAAPAEFEDILERLTRDVLPYASRSDHPRFFAFVPTSPTWPGVIGDLLATGFNIYQGAWLESAGPSAIELVVIDWFRTWLGLPETAGGLLVSGGSAANMTALACAADALLGADRSRGVVYLSAQAHSSAIRATRVLGFPPERVRVLPTDDEYRMRLDALEELVAADEAAGLEPFFVVGTAGTTNTGSVDRLDALADLCSERGLWLHVDAAYGGFAALTERGRRTLRGIERADTVTLDPHKWLYQPYEAGCLLARDRELLLRSFRILPDYLRDADVSGDREINFSDLGIQLTRSARALKIWVSLQYFGVDAFRAAIDRCLDLAQLAATRIAREPELELLAPPTLGVVCFRRRPPGVDDEAELARVNSAIVARMAASGEGMISSTRLHGRYALRVCVLNHASGPDDVARAVSFAAESPAGGEVEAHAAAWQDAELARFAAYDRGTDAGSL